MVNYKSCAAELDLKKTKPIARKELPVKAKEKGNEVGAHLPIKIPRIRKKVNLMGTNFKRFIT